MGQDGLPFSRFGLSGSAYPFPAYPPWFIFKIDSLRGRKLKVLSFDFQISRPHIGPWGNSLFKNNGKYLTRIGAFLNIGQVLTTVSGWNKEGKIQRTHAAFPHRLHIFLRRLGVGNPMFGAHKLPIVLFVIGKGTGAAEETGNPNPWPDPSSRKGFV
jgi:hypothetical protein